MSPLIQAPRELIEDASWTQCAERTLEATARSTDSPYLDGVIEGSEDLER